MKRIKQFFSNVIDGLGDILGSIGDFFSNIDFGSSDGGGGGDCGGGDGGGGGD